MEINVLDRKSLSCDRLLRVELPFAETCKPRFVHLSETKNQFAGTLLLILTVAAVVSAVLSFQAPHSFPLHDDGVTWVDAIYGRSGSEGRCRLYRSGRSGRQGWYPARAIKLSKSRTFRFVACARCAPGAVASSAAGTDDTYTLRGTASSSRRANIHPGRSARFSALYYQYLRRAFSIWPSACSSITGAPAPPRSLPFLPSLPGFVHASLLPLLRQAQHVRRGHVLGQCRRLVFSRQQFSCISA